LGKKSFFLERNVSRQLNSTDRMSTTQLRGTKPKHYFCPDDTYELNINELDFFAYSNNILYEWC